MDIYCEPCHQAGHVAIAEGYCIDCPEYLCGPCYKSHQRHKALVNHVLLDKDSMPIVTDSSKGDLDICEAKCTIHSNKVIELFCETCNKLVCHICVATDHRQCEKVKHIPDILKNLDHAEELQNFDETIKFTANEISDHEEKLQAMFTFNKEMRALADQELKCQRAKVISFFDQLEKNMDEQITSIENRNQDTLKAASERLDEIKTNCFLLKKDIEGKNTDQRCELFIAMRHGQENMKTFSRELEEIKKELRIQHYTLVPSDQIKAMMRTTTEICRIEVHRIASARLESEIDTKTSKKSCKMNGLTIMHGHYCVALDNFEERIMVIDTNSKCVTSEISVEAEAVTSVSDDQIAVSVSLSHCKKLRHRTQTCSHQIQFFTVSASGVIQRTKQMYDIEINYHGMVYCAGNIYGVNSSRIDKLDMTGKIIRTIHTDDTGSLRGIAVSPDGQTLYVTDSGKHSVTSMTLDGEIKAVYYDKDLKGACGITVDKHGYVYVCSYEKNIQQLTANLNKVQVLIEDDLSEIITYSGTENKLYIGKGSRIHLYSLNF